MCAVVIGAVDLDFVPLPSDLEAAIRRARGVEAAAQNRRQLLAAIAATSRLLAAAAHEGWPSRELAESAGLAIKATQRRITLARRKDHPSGLDLTPAPPKRPAPLPVAAREWLTSSEASAEFGVSAGTIAQWRRGGLLPRSRPRDGRHLLYSRTDLAAVVSGPRHRNGGVSWRAARALDLALADQ